MIEQGNKFTIAFECVDQDGKVVSLGKTVNSYVILWYELFG